MENADKYLNQIMRQKENLILAQLNDFISRGLLVIEQGPMSLVRALDSDKIELRQEIKLTLKDKEYIQKLEAENAELKKSLEFIKNMLRPLDVV